MADPQMRSFRCADGVDAAVLRTRAAGRFELAGDGGSMLRLTFYDTFDWRLHHAGLTLRLEKPSRRPASLCCTAKAGVREDCVQMDTAPRLAEDLPTGRLRTRLQAQAGIRALLPVADLRGRRQDFAVRNEDGKTVARCYLEHWRTAARGRPPSGPVGLLRLVPLRGYLAETSEVAGLLQGEGVEPCAEELLDTALGLAGRTAGDYSSKLRLQLEPTEDAASAVRRLLRSQLEIMRANEAGIRQDLDSEFLHDFRVAVRRSRSALTQLKSVFREGSLAPFREEFAWLGSVTGPKRDLDVHLLQFPAQQAMLQPAQRADLLPLRALLEQQRVQAGVKVVAALKSRRYRSLVQRWRVFLDQPGAEDHGPDAGLPVAEVANRRIWKVYRRVRREGRAITDDSLPAQLHELRKSCKKLRYLMEFFQSLYPPRKVRRAIAHLKDLQENLGEFQDQSVQTDSLRAHGEELARSGAAPVPTLLAMGALMDRIAVAQQETRSEFARRFDKFDSPSNQRLFRGLFRAGDGANGNPR